MKVRLYAKQYRPEYVDTLLWEGDMECIPRVGDMMFVFDGWGGMRLDRVYWDLPTQTAELSFDDRTGEFSREAKKRLGTAASTKPVADDKSSKNASGGGLEKQREATE